MLTLSVLKNHGEVYAFIYDDDSVAAVLLTLGRFASNPDLRFDWWDCAMLSAKIRGQMEDSACGGSEQSLH